MAYQPQSSPGQNYGGPTNVSAIASRASEVGRMTGVTPEIWDNVLQQMQQLVEDNEKLRETLKHNNSDITALLKSKEDEVKHLYELYWDARVSVLGFKARIVKLTGKREQEQQLQQQSDSSFLEDENKKLEDEKRKLDEKMLSTKDLAINLQDELNLLQTSLSSVERKEKELLRNIQSLQEENVHLRQQLTCPQPHPPTSQGEVDSFLQRMLDELKLEVTQWCDQLTNEASSAKSRGDYEMSKLQRENAHLKFKVSQQEHTIQEYKSDLDLINEEASSEHNDLMTKIRHLENEIKRKDTKNKELTKEISLLKEQLASAVSSEEIATIEREKQIEKERYHELSVDLSKVTSELEQARKQLQHMKDSSVNDNSEMDTYIQEMSMEMVGLTEDIAKKREEIKRQQAQITQLAKERDEAVTKVELLQEEFKRKELQIREENQKKINDDANHWRLQYETAQEELSKVTSELEQARKQLQHMKDSSVNDNSEMDTYIQEMSTEITGLTEDIAKKREEIKRQQAQITQLAKERDKAVTKITSLQEESKTKQEEFKKKELKIREENQRKMKEYIEAADHWRIQYETAQEDFGSERHAREKVKNAVDALRSNRESLQKQVDEFKKKVTDQQRTIATLEDKLADLDPNFIPVETYPPHWGMSSDSAHRKREEIKRQQAQITQLAKERDEAVTKFTSLQEEFKAKQEEFKKKELQIREENQRKIKEYIDDADHWRIQYETAQEDFGSERHAREKVENAVDALRSNRESLQKQIDEFKKKVTDQQRTIATLEDKLVELDPNFVLGEPHPRLHPSRWDMPPDDRVLGPKSSYRPPRR